MTLNRRKMIALGTGATALAMTGTPAAAHPRKRPSVPSDEELARSLSGGFRSRYATVNGVRLHYVTGGHGEPLLLVPGWPQTWWAYRKIMPQLARRYRVIAVDLRGMGGSDKPAGGYDKKTMAGDLHALVRQLGHRRVNIAGHDIGSKVAFSFAVNHAAATRKVAMLDALHPDDRFYQLPLLPKPGTGFPLWWYAFNQVQGLPEQLVAGRVRHLIDWFFAHSLADQSLVGDFDRRVYTRAYDSAEAVRASNAWYQSFHQDVEHMRSYGKVTVPLLGVASEVSHGEFQQVLPTLGHDVRVVKLANTVHYLPEEAPDRLARTLAEFFS
ncbi:alpha/beta fold hydrolase [Streptomyces sp. AC627_RSS907]|uniref:alpha/beta fold hydrolase n=1 Tax=Streptomyces sp. AC627_RSS907 TaxID=2823684 RepID=UPI001C2329A6|nr:alpha/beta hydrolase [Streptomyces sp. AC627_RSS907]